jgi:hypothetical protein
MIYQVHHQTGLFLDVDVYILGDYEEYVVEFKKNRGGSN